MSSHQAWTKASVTYSECVRHKRIDREYIKDTDINQCFKTDGQLIVAYSMTPAFG